MLFLIAKEVLDRTVQDKIVPKVQVFDDAVAVLIYHTGEAGAGIGPFRPLPARVQGKHPAIRWRIGDEPGQGQFRAF